MAMGGRSHQLKSASLGICAVRAGCHAANPHTSHGLAGICVSYLKDGGHPSPCLAGDINALDFDPLAGVPFMPRAARPEEGAIWPEYAYTTGKGKVVIAYATLDRVVEVLKGKN